MNDLEVTVTFRLWTTKTSDEAIKEWRKALEREAEKTRGVDGSIDFLNYSVSDVAVVDVKQWEGDE